MMRPASASPAATMLENFIERHDDVDSTSPTKSCSARKALVIFPGTAMRLRRAATRDTASSSQISGSAVAGARDDHRPVAVAHARAAGQQRVLVEHVGVGVDRDRGDVQFAARRALVQRLDVLQDVLEPPAAGLDFVLRERVKHERVVGIGRVAERQELRHAGRSRAPSRSAAEAASKRLARP